MSIKFADMVEEREEGVSWDVRGVSSHHHDTSPTRLPNSQSW